MMHTFTAVQTMHNFITLLDSILTVSTHILMAMSSSITLSIVFLVFAALTVTNGFRFSTPILARKSFAPTALKMSESETAVEWSGAKKISTKDKGLQTIMTNEQIAQILPHRYPFLLVDKVVEFEPGKRAVGIKCITANEPQFTGHFPGRPIMPGVLMIEAMAQLGKPSLSSVAFLIFLYVDVSIPPL